MATDQRQVGVDAEQAAAAIGAIGHTIPGDFERIAALHRADGRVQGAGISGLIQALAACVEHKAGNGSPRKQRILWV